MVNAAIVKRKLPSLLCNGETGNRVNDNTFMKKCYQLGQFRKRNPEKFDNLFNKILVDLERLDRELVLPKKHTF